MMRRTTMVIIIALLVSGCGLIMPSQTDHVRLINDGKAALRLSTDLYDEAMRQAGALYQSGACDENCKATSLAAANTFLAAARPTKQLLDSGNIDFIGTYQTLYDALMQLRTLIHGKGATLRPQLPPTPDSFRARSVRQSFAWPPANTQPHADRRTR